MSKKKKDDKKVIKDLVKGIVKGTDFERSVDGHFAHEVIAMLKDKHGAKDTKAFTECSVASWEAFVKMPNGDKVCVLNSYFMGPFTEITIYAKVKK